MGDQTLHPKEQLSQLFGSYKAEWLKEKQLFELFTKPSYFPELETSRPCILVGGRGTGKTTVLKCLSYEGQFILSESNPEEINKFQYYGFYYRVNTNRVTAFLGPELTEKDWTALFAHYFNLVLCESAINFLRWYETKTSGELNINPETLRLVAVSLNIDFQPNTRPTLSDLSASLIESKTRFEAYINNVVDGERPGLSLQGAPLDILFSELKGLELFSKKNFFFLIDEYENFEPYQQKVLNTLVKHSGQYYTFKIGVRELGIKERATLNQDEQLISPADYIKIAIAEKLDDSAFRNFALAVCNDRIGRIESDVDILRDVTRLLPGMTEDEEAVLLGLESTESQLSRIEINDLRRDSSILLSSLSPLQIYFFRFWAETQSLDLQTVIDEYASNPKVVDERYQNYKHSLLFTIRRRKTGIRKYYAGWDVFIRLSGRNIRYLLELVEQSLISSDEIDLATAVSPEQQTKAAQSIGKKNLGELEGLSVSGAQLKKLLLSIGRIFQVMALDPGKHSPEVNQFHLSDQSLSTDVEGILNSAVMHLALLRSPGNKLSDESDTREYDYMIHPIFSAFFEFSYRRKRKMTVSGEDLLGLIRSPRKTLKVVLGRTGRNLDDEQNPLPEQMRLFEGYYHGSN